MDDLGFKTTGAAQQRYDAAVGAMEHAKKEVACAVLFAQREREKAKLARREQAIAFCSSLDLTDEQLGTIQSVTDAMYDEWGGENPYVLREIVKMKT